ncbi:hypothetical protein [Halomonas sp. GT]|uniref:hypothetical protein n=1 Tax=Halomonas sp. GT TaxID=1971364 RepID=UPI0009F1EEEB|nr:hypothetical protein [Halomonas sp. GT]
MLVLDETYTGALFSQAAKDGFIKHAIHEGSLHKDPTTSILLKKGLSPIVRQDVLWDLLLFHPAICFPFDNFNVDALVTEGLIRDQLSLEEQSEYTKVIDNSPESILLFEKLILGDLKDQGLKAISQADIKKYINGAKKYNFPRLYSDGILYWNHSSYEELLNFYRSGFSGLELNLPGSTTDTTISGDDFSDCLLAQLTKEKFNFYKENEQLLKQVKAIRDSACKWFMMTGAANKYNAVLKIKTPKIKLIEKTPYPVQTTSATSAVVKIWLSEVEVLPKLTKIEDVLRLREDKSIENFKSSILEWADAISCGHEKAEKNLRSYIKTANKELIKIKKIQKVAGWATLISLPIEFALLMNGSPTIPTSPIGFGLYVYEKTQHKKYDWIMFGR